MALYDTNTETFLLEKELRKARISLDWLIPRLANVELNRSERAGILGLTTRASYSMYKHCCFPKLRTFLYADGPVYLTKVVRKPDVTRNR